MKTMLIDEAQKIEFSEIAQGEPFLDTNGGVFMKFLPTCDAEDADNAVNLESGYGCMFDDEEVVRRADVRVLMFSR